MGFRFRKSINIGSAKITASKSGISYSAGCKGLRVTKKANGGIRTTVSIPSTGISYVEETSASSNKKSAPKVALISSLVTFGVLVIIAVVFICGYISTNNHNKDVQNELLKHNYSTDFTFIDTPKMTYEYNANKNGYRCVIDGIIQNISGYPVVAVKVIFNFYDSNGIILGSAYDYIGDLDNQSSKKFKVITTEYYQNKAHKANIANVEYSLIIE